MKRVFVKLFVILIFWLTVSAAAFSQEIWLRPDKFFFTQGERATIQIVSGADFIAEPVRLDPGQMGELKMISRSDETDLSPRLRQIESEPLTIRLDHEGFCLLDLTTSSAISIQAAQFNEYLKQYGLDDILAQREKENLQNSSAIVKLDQYIRLSLRAGRNHGQGWVTKKTLPIEIVPDKNPQTLKRGDRITFTILEDGSPAFGVRVKIWNRWDNRTTIQNIYTEKDGTVSTHISSPGDWMVSVVKVKEGSNDNEYIADGYNLVFGYR